MALSEIQKAAFLPLYERYHDERNPCLRGAEDILSRLNSDIFHYFTIFLDGEIVGGIFYRSQGSTSFSVELKEGQYYLQRLYIKPDLQCNGLGQNAILLCEESLPNCKEFFVDFPEDLVKNRRCYEKAGFTDTGNRVKIQDGLVLAYFEKIRKD